MAQGGSKQPNTAYGMFLQACWAQHKRQYPETLINKEIEEFNKQCSVWWHNLPAHEQQRFQEMADRSNQALNPTYTTMQNVNGGLVQNAIASTSTAAASAIPSFGSTFGYNDYAIQGTSGQAANQGAMLNYSTNTTQPAFPGIQRMVGQTVQQQQQQSHHKKEPTPSHLKKPLTSYMLFSRDETLKIRNEFPNHSLTEQAKEIGRRWGLLDPSIKAGYKQKYDDSFRSYKEQYAGQLQQQKQKMKKDPNAPKKPLSPYFLFWQDERLKVKAQFPDYSITEEAKEVGRRWKVIDPQLKQAYQSKYQECFRQYKHLMEGRLPKEKHTRDPGAPKKPLSPYFLYFQDERLKVKAQFPNYTVTEEAKEVGRRWAVIDPVLKQVYQQKYQDAFQNYKRMMEGRGNHAT